MPSEKEKVSLMIWILVGYMWLVIHRPFEVWPILATIRLERVYMIFTLVAWFALSPKKLTTNICSIAIFLMACSITLSTLASPYMGFGNNPETEEWYKILVFYLLIVTTIQKEADLRFFVTAFVVIFGIYMLHSYREFLCGKFVYDAGVVRMCGVDSTLGYANQFASAICYAIAWLIPAMFYWNERKYRWIYVAYILFGFWCILLTGSRTGFIMISLIIAFIALYSKYRYLFIVACLVGAPFAYSVLPETAQTRITSLFQGDYREGNEGKSVFGQRGGGFWIGLDVMSNNPLGTGPGTGPAFVPELHKLDYHNLYGQVMGDLGIPGTFSYLLLFVSVYGNHFTARSYYMRLRKTKGGGKEVNYLYWVSFTTAFVYTMLLAGGWSGHTAYRYYWLWFAAFQMFAISFLRVRVESFIPTPLPSRAEIPYKNVAT